MGAWDWLSSKAGWIKDHLDPGNLLHNNDVPGQPGVNNAPASTLNGYKEMRRDPVTGLYQDPTTGQVYYDQFGKQLVTNPNVAQQVAQNFQTSQAILGGLSGARADAAAANTGQASLVNNLNGVINGTAPSVAGSQLAGTLGNIQRTQMATASGFGGNNAFAARRQAMQNIAQTQQQASQQLAQLRAQEVAAAMAAKGGVLQNMAGNANTQAAQDIAGGANFAEIAAKGQGAQQGLQTDTDKANIEERNDKAQRTAGAIGSLWGFGGGGKK